jgi:LemA protein
VLLLKRGGLKLGIVILIILLAIALYVLYIYNRLVVLRNRIKNAWAQIDVQLKRRYDLIPNLVETVKGYAKHEKGVFERVTEARAQAIGASSVKDQGQAENQLTGALKSLFAVAENYPDLKANQNFLMLQEELAGTEGKIAYARQFYNDNVMEYNIYREKVPSNVIANLFDFGPKEMFEIEIEAERGPVRVKFD